jgi:2,5-furandicarboxylate decarboxylase 1
MSKPVSSLTIPEPDPAHVPPATLAEWLDRLAARNRLRVIRPNLALKFGVAAVAARLDGESATLFPSPGGHAIPVVSGIVSRREWIADAMGVAPGDIVRRFQMAANAPLPCERVAKAAVHEVVHRGPIDIAKLLPVPVHNELDAGPYLSAGLLISANPKTGKQNVSINRCQVKGGSRLGVSVSSRDTGSFVAAAEAAGEGLPAAIVIGVDPLTLLASQAIVASDEDELGVSGALHGRPLRVVKCLGSQLLVPADAETSCRHRPAPARSRRGEPRRPD